MTNEQTAEILKRIDMVAAKLGVAANELWAILVKQAVITGYRDAVLFVLFSLLSAGMFRVAARCKPWDYGDWSEGRIMLTVGAVVAAIFALFAGCFAFGELLNPQYYAATDLLRLLGK